MFAQRKIRLIVIASVILLAGLVMFFMSGSGPFYKGASLETWIDRYYATWLPNEYTDSFARDSDAELAQVAIRNIGTNGIPYLLRWIDYREAPYPSQWELEFKRYFNAAARFIGDSPRESRGSIRADEAMLALKLLGPMVTNSLPQLILIFETHDASATYYATDLIKSMGDVGVKIFIAELNHPRPHVRDLAAQCLGDMGEAARPAVPFLLKTLKDRDWGVSSQAAMALGNLKFYPELCVPALVKFFNLSPENPFQRSYAAMALTRFGTNAAAAVPFLLQAIETNNIVDGSPSFTNCLFNIAPEIYMKRFPN